MPPSRDLVLALAVAAGLGAGAALVLRELLAPYFSRAPAPDAPAPTIAGAGADDRSLAANPADLVVEPAEDALPWGEEFSPRTAELSLRVASPASVRERLERAVTASTQEAEQRSAGRRAAALAAAVASAASAASAPGSQLRSPLRQSGIVLSARREAGMGASATATASASARRGSESGSVAWARGGAGEGGGVLSNAALLPTHLGPAFAGAADAGTSAGAGAMATPERSRLGRPPLAVATPRSLRRVIAEEIRMDVESLMSPRRLGHLGGGSAAPDGDR